MPGNLKEDTWVTSVEVKPSEPAVTHHICLAYIPHHPDTKYFTAIAREVPRDDDGVEIVRGRCRGRRERRRQPARGLEARNSRPTS
jgi:hypothetical protein